MNLITTNNHGTNTQIVERRMTTCRYTGPAMHDAIRIRHDVWSGFDPEIEASAENFIFVPTLINPGQIHVNSVFDLGDTHSFRAFSNDSGLESLSFGRAGRHFHAVLSCSALRESISDLTRWSAGRRNILDVGNAGETWLYQMLKLSGPMFVENLNYYTLDICDDVKSSRNSTAIEVPSDRWHHFAHDARKVDEIEKRLLPEEGFDVIHIAQASCELFTGTDYIQTLEKLYSLLAPGGTIIFPAKKIELDTSGDPEKSIETLYKTAEGEFGIGGNISVLIPETEDQIAERGAISGRDWIAYRFWMQANIYHFYQSNRSEIDLPEYCRRYFDAREPLRIESLSFFNNVRIRSVSIQTSDVLLNQNYIPTLSSRATLTATKPFDK